MVLIIAVWDYFKLMCIYYKIECTLVLKWIELKQNNKLLLEYLGIDPSTSRMLSERSTIWASTPMQKFPWIFDFEFLLSW